jgi:hypothetical protein
MKWVMKLPQNASWIVEAKDHICFSRFYKYPVLVLVEKFHLEGLMFSRVEKLIE